MSDDIENVRKTEERRSRRPVDPEMIDERRRQLAAFREILNYGDFSDLETAMRGYGLVPDSHQWAEVVRIWNDEREPH